MTEKAIIARKMVSENECNIVVMAIARFICEEEEASAPCDKCQAYASNVVIKLAQRRELLPIDLNDPDMQQVIADKLQIPIFEEPEAQGSDNNNGPIENRH